MIEIVLENRWAYVVTAKRKEHAFLRDYFSYFWPAARYDRRYKLYLWAKWKAEQNDTIVPENVGWDGMIRLYKDGRIPAGLFRAMREEFEAHCREQRYRLRVTAQLPKVREVRTELYSGEEKYRFQSDCVKMMQKATQHGGGIVLSATGSGKTSMAAKYFLGFPKYKCLFVVDTLNLLYQSAKELGSWMNCEIGVIGEGMWNTERVTVATSQTLHLYMDDRKFRKWYDSIQLVIVDELHAQMGRRNFEVLEKIEPISCIGLTATLQLSQKPVRMKAYSFAGPVIYQFPIETATKKKVVSKGRVIQLMFPDGGEENVNYKGRQGYQLEYQTNVVEHAEKHEACRRIAKVLLKAGRYVLVLAERIAHVDQLAEVMPKPNSLIRGAVNRGTRDKAIGKFEKGKTRLMIASRVFTKGVSIRRVDAMIDAAEGGSKNDAIQKYGRGVRLHDDKTELVYVDIGSYGVRFGLRAKRRRKAFRQAGIPVKIVKVANAVDAVAAVRKFLEWKS